MCNLDVKICNEEQYLGTGLDGCPECLQCPRRNIECPEGGAAMQGRKVVNQCPTYYCSDKPVRCTKEMKYCDDCQYLGTGSSGCQECLPCPIAVPRCPVGSTPMRNPAVLNRCPTYSCVHSEPTGS